MKKLLIMAVATMLVSGAVFAGGGKKGKKGKSCSNTEACCKKDGENKDKSCCQKGADKTKDTNSPKS
jgi:hypothetical protein